MPMGWTYAYGRHVKSIKTGQEITEVNEKYECGRSSFYLVENAADIQIRESSRHSGSSDPDAMTFLHPEVYTIIYASIPGE